MVEEITTGAVEIYARNLKVKNLLHPELSREIDTLITDMERFTNWTDSGGYLRKMDSTTMAGAGPMSKFLRTLAFALETLDLKSETLAEKGIQVTRIILSRTSSGCSDYRGHIEIDGTCSGNGETVILEGPFVWDCAAHRLPQSRAAREMGYSCMVTFPELLIRSEEIKVGNLSSEQKG